MGKHASNWRHHVTTSSFYLGFEVTVHVDNVGHDTPSVHIPSLKSFDLPVWKIWHISCLSINRPGDHNFWPLNGFKDHPCYGLPFCQFSLAKPFHSRLGSWPRTDGQTTAIIAYCPTLWGRGHNKPQLGLPRVLGYPSVTRVINDPGNFLLREGYPVIEYLICRIYLIGFSSIIFNIFLLFFV